MFVQNAVLLLPKSDASEEIFRIMAVIQIAGVGIVPAQVREHHSHAAACGNIVVLKLAAHERSENIHGIFKFIRMMGIRDIFAVFDFKTGMAMA